MLNYLKTRWKSFGYAGTGVVYALKTQAHARIHLVAGVCVVIFGALLGVSLQEWLWIILAIMLVWFAEMVNTAIEYMCDVVSPEHSENVKHAKDIAAGAVLIVAIGAVIIGIMIFYPHIHALI